MTLREELLRLELALASRDPARIEGGLMALIADDFLEHGASGRTWDRAAIAEVLAGPVQPPVELSDVRLALLAPDVALLTYATPTAMRASVWVLRDGRWVIRFHQGTRRPAAPSEPTGGG
ncbi:MAG: DUF4440 domain-containing protein [Chloroflexota bacterium]